MKLGGGDLISREAVFRGNLLTLGVSAVTKRPRGGPCSASAPCRGVLLGAAGAHGPRDLPPDRPLGSRPPRPADMLPASEEVCGEKWVEGPKWPLHFAGGRGWKSDPGPLVSQVKRLNWRRSHGILRPALGLAGQTVHLRNDPGRGRGSLPG